MHYTDAILVALYLRSGFRLRTSSYVRRKNIMLRRAMLIIAWLSQICRMLHDLIVYVS